MKTITSDVALLLSMITWYKFHILLLRKLVHSNHNFKVKNWVSVNLLSIESNPIKAGAKSKITAIERCVKLTFPSQQQEQKTKSLALY